MRKILFTIFFFCFLGLTSQIMRTDTMPISEDPHDSKLHHAIDHLKDLLEPNNETKFFNNDTRTSLNALVKKALNLLHYHKDETSEGTSDESSEASDDKSFHHRRAKWAMKFGDEKKALKKEAKEKWNLIKEDILKGSNTAVESWDTVNARLMEAKMKFKEEWKETKRKARESRDALRGSIENVVNNTGL